MSVAIQKRFKKPQQIHMNKNTTEGNRFAYCCGEEEQERLKI